MPSTPPPKKRLDKSPLLAQIECRRWGLKRIKASELKQGEEFRTLLTDRCGTAISNGTYHGGVDVVLDPLPPNDDLGESKRLHPDVIIGVSR